ncbi:hypothetical protein KIL84_008080 [Mauremys mutica]|uniref:Uncharacterized protein n=1 Tax=Mauremys mutica TaxID=74926 RepID=A0A9D3X2K1_9SAUR|nr:hypothetical protein KIL84_008080 [Mauremys mutica]
MLMGLVFPCMENGSHFGSQTLIYCMAEQGHDNLTLGKLAFFKKAVSHPLCLHLPDRIPEVGCLETFPGQRARFQSLPLTFDFPLELAQTQAVMLVLAATDFQLLSYKYQVQ